MNLKELERVNKKRIKQQEMSEGVKINTEKVSFKIINEMRQKEEDACIILNIVLYKDKCYAINNIKENQDINLEEINLLYLISSLENENLLCDFDFNLDGKTVTIKISNNINKIIPEDPEAKANSEIICEETKDKINTGFDESGIDLTIKGYTEENENFINGYEIKRNRIYEIKRKKIKVDMPYLSKLLEENKIPFYPDFLYDGKSFVLHINMTNREINKMNKQNKRGLK